MGTLHWVYKQTESGGEKIGGPFENKGDAERTATLLNQETESGAYFADSPHNHVESNTAAEVFGGVTQ